MNLILDHNSIREYIDKGVYLVDPFAPTFLQPASYDFRLGRELLIPYPYSFHDCQEVYWLQPNEFILGSTHETFYVPADLVGELKGKSTLGRRGLILHGAGFVDPGWNGVLTLELKNVSSSPMPLQWGMTIGQMVWYKLLHPVDKLYDGRYQKAIGPEHAK